MCSEKQGKGLRVALTTLGCKVNQFESASFQSGFEEQGAELVPFSQDADIYVINSCAVTAKAGAQSRRMIRRALRANPKARLVVTGCFAQVASKEILGLTDRPICIVGNGNKHHLVEIALARRECDLEMYTGDIGRKKEICPLSARRFAGRTRAYVKVQDGCNRFCSYCIVPYARGRSRSLSPAKVLEQVKVFVREGYKEIVLTGIHIGTYGEDLAPAMRLYDLLVLLAKEDLPVRYRISSLEPVEVTEEILGLLADSPHFLPHLHIPLQSGDSEILRKMNRRYSAAEFADIVGMVLRYLPDAAIGADVLVGFPGEDEEAFANTRDLLVDLPVSYLHVFPYSKRPGTVAAGMAGQVAVAVKEERVALLRELDHKKRTRFYGAHLGTVRQVLAETGKNKLNLMKGFTDNYIPVYFDAPQRLENQLLDVRLDRIMDHRVLGTLVTEHE